MHDREIPVKTENHGASRVDSEAEVSNALGERWGEGRVDAMVAKPENQAVDTLGKYKLASFLVCLFGSQQYGCGSVNNGMNVDHISQLSGEVEKIADTLSNLHRSRLKHIVFRGNLVSQFLDYRFAVEDDGFFCCGLQSLSLV